MEILHTVRMQTEEAGEVQDQIEASKKTVHSGDEAILISINGQPVTSVQLCRSATGAYIINLTSE